MIILRWAVAALLAALLTFGFVLTLRLTFESVMPRRHRAPHWENRR